MRNSKNKKYAVTYSMDEQHEAMVKSMARRVIVSESLIVRRAVEEFYLKFQPELQICDADELEKLETTGVQPV
jgi:hypothetical protein